jgi:superfamily II DNA or RNA helicase
MIHDLFSAASPPTMRLRPYQNEASDQTVVGFDGGAMKQLVVIPTGGGKTILFAFLAQRFQPGRTLIIAHREELLVQAKDKIQKATGLWCEIEKAEQRASLDSPVVVASIQTLRSRKERWPQDHFDLVVVDEAHHVLADSYLQVLAYFDGHAKVLGVTATPDRGDKKNLGKYFEKVAFEVSIARLIREGWLSPIRVKTLPVAIDLRGIRKVAGDLSADEVGERLNPWIEEVAREMAREAWDRKSIIFLPLIKTSERMRDALLRQGIEARCISGYDDDRAATLEWFAKAGPGSALCNSMLLTEGFDQPDVDCVVNLRPTQMRSLFAQMIGRGTRVVCPVDGLPDAEARVAAIAASDKPHCLLLDFLWQTEKMSLVTATRLFTSCDETAKEVEKKMIEVAAVGGSTSSVDVMGVCEDVEQARLRTVVKVLKANQKRPKGTHDAIEMCMSLGSRDLADYDPMSAREARPATDNQLAALQNAGFDPGSITCFGHASAIMDRLAVRQMEGLATPKQVRMMERLRHPSPHSATKAQALQFLNDKVWSRR